MKILFLGQERILHPWYDDVRQLCTRKYEIVLFDPAKPMAPQFTDVDVVIDQGGSVGTRAMIDAAVKNGVKLWQVLGTGLDNTPVDYILEAGLTLANTPGMFSAVALAEHVLFMMLFFSKQFMETTASLKARLMCTPINTELETTTLGLIGFGASARALATRAAALGMQIIAIDVAKPEPTVLDETDVEFLGSTEKLPELLAQSDYVSLHLPLTPETRHIMDAPALAQMKSSAVLINIARGELIDEKALYEVLKTRKIRGAGLDVFAIEPVDPNHPLLTLDNVMASPHMAGVTTGTSRRRAEVAFENCERVAQGREPLFTVQRSLEDKPINQALSARL